MYAVLVTGGKQYKAEVGQTLTIEKLDIPAGQEVQFDQVLMIGDGETVTVGAPVVSGASVTGKVVRQDRGPKIIVFKYKPKVRYRRKTGHRQYQTHVLVQAITHNGTVHARPQRAAAPVIEGTIVPTQTPEVIESTSENESAVTATE